MGREAKTGGSLDVLIIAPNFSRGTASYRRIKFFIDYLIKNGIRLRCIGGAWLTSYGIGKPSHECLEYPVPLIPPKLPLFTIVNLLLSSLILVYILFLKPRVVIISVPDYSGIVPSFIGCKLTGAKFVVDVRDSLESSFYGIINSKNSNKFYVKVLGFIFKTYYSILLKADVILAVTENLRKTLEKRSPKKVFLVPNGADLSIFKGVDKGIARMRLGLDANAFIAVFIGSIGGYYDLPKLIALLSKLSDNSKRKALVLLAGSLIDRTIQTMIKSFSFKNVVRYLGKLGAEDLVLMLSASDIGIISRVSSPVFDYAIPTKFYEYIALELPILAICNKDSELWRIIQTNKLGFACEPNDFICIAKSLKIFMTTEEYLQIKDNVKKFRYQVDRTIGARKLLEILNYLLNKAEHHD